MVVKSQELTGEKGDLMQEGTEASSKSLNGRSRPPADLSHRRVGRVGYQRLVFIVSLLFRRYIFSQICKRQQAIEQILLKILQSSITTSKREL